MQKLDQFRSDLLNNVDARAEADGDFRRSSFVSEAGDRLVDAEALDNLSGLHFRGSGRRNRSLAVDGFDLGDSDESICLAVAHMNGADGEVPTITKTEAQRMLSSLQGFLEESLAGEFTREREPSTPEYALAQDLRGHGRPSRYRLLLLTDCMLSERTKEFPSSEVNGVPVDYEIWDVRRFWEVAESAQGREELIIDLTEWAPAGLPALAVESEGGLTTYLAAVPGPMLADLYLRYGSRLLESNVRSYLSARGKINKEIQRTIHQEPHMFLAYNNGITATATGVDTSDGGGILTVTDLQIVNGGQTTASLFYVRRDIRGTNVALDDIVVQMKLVVVQPAQATEIVPNISRYANSQNRINEADFFSNSGFHVRMEELSRRLMAPQVAGQQYQTKWYYERTRGQYQNDRALRSGADQRRFDLINPKNQIITKTDAARFEVAWAQQPHQVSAGAQKNFMAFAGAVAKRWNDRPEEFHEQYFRDLVAKAILYRDVRTAVAKQDWYEQGYLANIVAYTMAKLSAEIAKQASDSRMNFPLIWSRQRVPEPILDQCLIIARAALDHLTSETRDVLNVTEWAKREKAWDTFRAKPLPLAPAFLDTLLTSLEVADQASTAKAKQAETSLIELQMRVLETPAEEWESLWAFVQANRLGTEAQRGILGKLRSGIGFVPSDAQVKQLHKLVEAAEIKGFRAEI